MIALDEARASVAAAFATRRTGVERVDLADGVGRVLAAPLAAPFDVPGFANSAMDGYAVRAADLEPDADTTLRCIDVRLAGRATSGAIERGECARITTGAPLPDGADTVVIREHARVDGERIVLAPGTMRGANVRGPTDDHAAGDRVVPAGRVLAAGDLAAAASFGLSSVEVAARPRIAIVVTGDELARPGETLGYGRRYESNGVLVRALAAEAGARTVSVESVADDPEAIAHALARAARVADLVVTTGGVSAGEADHVPALVERLGTVGFWKVAMRPGMPVLFGEVYGTALFGLPGNPVSVFATFIAFVEPALEALAGCEAPRRERVVAQLVESVDKRHERVELRRASLVQRGGAIFASLHPSTSSGALRSVVESDGLAELGATARVYAAGETVVVHRFRTGGVRSAP